MGNRNFCTFDLYLSVTFLVSRGSVDECEVFIARVIVMQPALLYYELHIWFALRFSVYYEHLVFTIIGDLILLYDVAQSNGVGDGYLAEPNIFVTACQNPPVDARHVMSKGGCCHCYAKLYVT